MRPLRSLALTLLLPALSLASPPPATLTIHTDRPGIAVSPTLYGIFFEDISRSADGGLYPELLQNRSFEDAPMPVGWEVVTPSPDTATVKVDTAHPINAENPHYLDITINKPGPVILSNTGFHGVAVRQGTPYRLSLRARSPHPAPLVVSLVSSGSLTLASTTLNAGGEWKELTATLTPTATDAGAKLVLSPTASLSLDMVSLMPADTWKGHPFRADLAQFLDDMRPAFVRFPGGCWVEGETMATAYRWKKTVLPVDRRPTVHNLWKYEATNGLGFHEYLQLCEDLHAAPLYVANVGMSHKETVPMDRLDEWVQDALDAVEYANGDTSTKYGALRAANGHPAPFNLKFLEIGNENGGPDYDARYAVFYDALKKKYPDVRLIADLWHGTPKSRPIDLLDEHYYSDPSFFIRNADRYDAYPRNSYKVYVGEYAVTKGCGKGNLRAAVAEAAFMTGMERNSDVVQLASYAPLYAHVHYTAWTPNAINFDNARSYGTPSYYVQQMFSRNRADTILPVDISAQSTTPEPHTGQIGIGTWNTQAEFKDITVTPTPLAGTQRVPGDVTFKSDFSNGLSGFTHLSGDWVIRGGNVRQTSNIEGAFALVGDPKWTDYTISLKAKKLTGSEGFLIRFHSTGDKDFTMWNLGGWRNTKTAVEISRDGGKSTLTADSPVTIEPQRWYDIRIETRGDNVKCYLDNQLVHDFTYPKAKSLFAVAGRAGNDTILKVANVSADPQPATIKLAGLPASPSAASVTTLTSASGDDENSLENPTKVAPEVTRVDVRDGTLAYTFPANSVTVVRVPSKP